LSSEYEAEPLFPDTFQADANKPHCKGNALIIVSDKSRFKMYHKIGFLSFPVQSGYDRTTQILNYEGYDYDGN